MTVPSRVSPAPSPAHPPVNPHRTQPPLSHAEPRELRDRGEAKQAERARPAHAQRPSAAFPGRHRRLTIRDNMQIEDYDIRLEEMRLHSLQRELEMKERQGLAVQAALAEHSVTSYVRNLPVEDATYPAIEYLRLHPQDDVDEEQEGVQEDPVGVRIQEGLEPYRQYITWCMPAHDLTRPDRKGCGFIRSSTGGIVYSACPDDPEHHCKGKRRHCWSLRCPKCMNDTALKRGVQIEKQLLSYKVLSEKKGISVGDIGHWVVSPPQDLVKRLCQTKPEFDDLCKHVDDSMVAFGATAGVTIFHPWRQKEDEWNFSPHFHILCYGRIDTTEFRRQNPGWLIKKVHPREKIRSIRHTAAYLTTHMGLGMAEKDPDEIDWDLKILDMLVPGLLSPGADYTEKDYNEKGEGKGRMLGDLSGVDWEQWTMKALAVEFKIRYWGGASKRNIRTLGIYRQYKIRVCKECHKLLRTYDGHHDCVGTYIRYIRDDPVVVFAEDFELVRNVFQSFKSRLRDEHLTIVDFSRMCPLTLCTLDLGLPIDEDLVMAGPFEEPDEYFLRRQREAFGNTVDRMASEV